MAKTDGRKLDFAGFRPFLVFCFLQYDLWSLSRSDPSNIFMDTPSSNDPNGIPDPRETICKRVSAQTSHQSPPLNSRRPITTLRCARECWLAAPCLKVMVDEVFVLKQGHNCPEIGDHVLINGTGFGPKYQYIARVISGQ